MEQSKKRDMNFELLRIISMIMILCLHYLGKSGSLILPYMSTNYIIAYAIEILSLVAVNIYILISGYYLVKSKFNIKRIIKLDMQVLFYTVGILILLLIFARENVGIAYIIRSIFPIFTNYYWFITNYAFLYLLSPFLNLLISKISKNSYKTLLIIGIIALSVIQTIVPFNTSLDSTGGYSLIWFILLYLIGGYIKLYSSDIKGKKAKYLIGYFVVSIIIFLLRETSIYLTENVSQILATYKGTLINYNSTLILASSVLLFLYFKNVTIKNNALLKIIGKIASLSLSVYLIHENLFLQTKLWGNLGIQKYQNTPYFIIHLICTVLVIFIVCCIVEYFRQLLMKLLAKTKTAKKLEEKIDKATESIKKKYVNDGGL